MPHARSLAFTGLAGPILEFVTRHALPAPNDAGCRRSPLPAFGAYRYSLESRRPTLYSSTYAAMTRSLFGDLEHLSDDERNAWVGYLSSHQDDDGLFRDPVTYGEGWYEGDPFWCGRPHLTTHVLTALACLGATAPKEFTLAKTCGTSDAMVAWLESRDWGERVAWTGNEIMNLLTILQYARDFHHDRGAARAIETFYEWMPRHHFDPATGLWGPAVPDGNRIALSHAVQAAYHWWGFFLYDRGPIPSIEPAIDRLLETGNPLGGFGWGVHHPEDPYVSSACEDIDSIEPLARFSLLTDYRRDEIIEALRGALPAVLSNRTNDGGFSFIRNTAFSYGHPELSSSAGTGAMFPTWFRTLSIALAESALCILDGRDTPWRFVRCPVHQFAPERIRRRTSW